MNTQAPAPTVWWLIWATITAAFFVAVGIFETTAIRTAALLTGWGAAAEPLAAARALGTGLSKGNER